VLDGHDWPYVIVGFGYGALAVAMLVLGGIRQRSLARELRDGRFLDLSSMWVTTLTTVGAGLAVITMLIVVIDA
jgi:hypothetical protein